jgi:hypothetical protein
MGPSRPGRSARVQTGERKIKLSSKDLEDLKAGRYLRFQLLSEDDARYWLKLWNEGKSDRKRPLSTGQGEQQQR